MVIDVQLQGTSNVHRNVHRDSDNSVILGEEDS